MQTRRILVILGLFLFSGLGPCLQAAPMDGFPIEYTQPNGTVIHLQVFGDEYYAETRTLDGYTVVFDPATKAYYYANLSANGNDLVSSSILVGTGTSLAGLPKHLAINPSSRKEKSLTQQADDPFEQERKKRWTAIKQKTREHRLYSRQSSMTQDSTFIQASSAEGASAAYAVLAPPSSETTGVRVGLTIPVEFPDEAGTISRQEVDNFCNEPGYSGFGNAGSIYDYFLAQSDEKLRYYNIVTPYIMAPHPKSYYNDTEKNARICGQLLLNDVLQVLIEQNFDFSHCTTNSSGRIYAINMFFAGSNSGRWAKGLWPHRGGLIQNVDLGGGIYADQYQTSNMGNQLTMAIFCHENGHLLFGYPDLYDSNGSYGVGKYSLMCKAGTLTHPVNVDGYLRYHSGWVETIPINTTSHLRGSVRVDSGPLYLFNNINNAAEYYLLDNREQIGWEAGADLPDQGFLAMHCDENGDRNDQQMTAKNHFELSIEQADGLFELEHQINRGGANDLFHAGNKTSFNDTTLPNTRWWNNATTNPASGDPSGLDIHDISTTGETMTFIVGSGSLEGMAPLLGVDRAMLEPTAFFAASPPSDKFAVWNQGGGTLPYTISSQTPWISLSASSGTVTENSDLITVNYNTAALDSGTHSGTIVVTNFDNQFDVRTIHVQLTVEAAPVLSVSPASLSVTGLVQHVSTPSLLVVDNAGGSSLSYTINAPSWLDMPITNGMVSREVDALEVGFDATDLATGVYTGTVEVASPEPTNAPVRIPVSFYATDLLLTAPLTGNYTNGESVAIEWNSIPNTYPFVDIELWRNGKQKVVIADNTPNDGLFNWTVPAILPSGSNYTIQVSCEGSPSFKETGPLKIWKYRESFENGTGSWVDQTDDDFDWTRTTGGTPSSGTGPFGASDGSYYIYTESDSPNYPNKIANITNQFDFGATASIDLIFDYHMYGATMGSLHLDLFDGTVWTPDIWTIAGEQQQTHDSPWHSATIDLSPHLSGGAFGLRFRGITESSWQSDIAVDNVRLANYVETMLTNNVPASWMDGFGLLADDATVLLDSDGDGVPNWKEYHAGTSPVDPESVFRLDHTEAITNGFVFQWSAVYGKTYHLWYTPDLSGTWQQYTNGIPGIEPLCTHTVVTDQATEFIRIEVEP